MLSSLSSSTASNSDARFGLRVRRKPSPVASRSGGMRSPYRSAVRMSDPSSGRESRKGFIRPTFLSAILGTMVTCGLFGYGLNSIDQQEAQIQRGLKGKGRPVPAQTTVVEKLERNDFKIWTWLGSALAGGVGTAAGLSVLLPAKKKPNPLDALRGLGGSSGQIGGPEDRWNGPGNLR